MPVTASLIVGGVSAVTSGIKAYRAHKQLKELQKQEMPNYAITPEMQHAYSRAEGMTNRGFSGAEEAAFKANLGQSSNTSYRQALDQSGGGMSQAILGGLNSRNVGALNQFAGQDAALRRQNIQYADSLAGQLQNQTNMATEQDIARRLEMERGYGQAVSQNLNNAQSGLNYGLTMGLGNMDFNKADAFAGDASLPFAKGGNPAQPTYMMNPAYKAPEAITPSYGVTPQYQGPFVAQGIYNAPFVAPQGAPLQGPYNSTNYNR